MNKSIIRAVKRVQATLLAQLCIIQQTQSLITIANAYQNTSGQLGTQQSLGSPLLNNNVSADQFNPWEQIAFGIYLSNYTNPFIDSYEQAFQVGAGYGSNGAGAQSLQFSAGSEATNEDVIRGMLNIAINMEKNVALQPIYVTYNKQTLGKIEKSPVITQGQQIDDSASQSSESESSSESTSDPNSTDNSESTSQTEPDSGFNMGSSTSGMSRATLQDLFFLAKDSQSGAYMDVVNSLTSGEQNINGLGSIFYRQASTSVTVNKGDINPPMIISREANIPTFILTNSQNTGYKAIVLDYTDSYDIQSFGATVVKAAQAERAYKHSMFEDISDKFDDMQRDQMKTELDKYPLSLDCFGNIVTEVNGKRYIVYPACLNQHLTKTPTINLINQLVMNGVTTSTDSNNFILYGGFQKNEAWLTQNFTGISAFNNGNTGVPTGQIAIYFDTDSVIGNKVNSGDIAWDQQSKTTSTNVHWGNALKTVFNSKIGAQNNSIGFKLQVVNPDDTAGLWGESISGKDLLYKNAIVAQQIFQNQQYQNTNKVNTDLQLLYDQKQSQSIFGDAVAVQVMTAPASGSATITNVARQYVNFVYQSYINSQSSEVRDEIDNILNTYDTRENIRKYITTTDSGNPSNTLIEFWKAKGGQSGYWASPQTQASQATLDNGLLGGKYVGRLLPTNWKVGGQSVQSKLNVGGKADDADITLLGQTDDELFGRTVVLFNQQNVMQAVQDVLNLKGGADFETYATDVYYTYLKFYGILNDFGVANDGSKFNPEIFSEDLVSDLTKINELLGDGNYMTSEQKLSQILDGTYTLLQRQLDRDYNITDFIYNQYYKMVFGRSQSATVESNIQTKSANGFLQIHTYSENFLTAFFIENYARYQQIILIIIVFIVIVKAQLSKKGFIWGLGSVALVVNIVLLMPQIGEITPYICNLIIQNQFQNSIQFWQISETLNNYNADSGLAELNGLQDEELAIATNIYKSHSALNVDHTLMMKLDISKKIMSTDKTDYTALQQMQTTRWLLPMIVQQWQAQDKSHDYVQVTLGQEMDNLQNMYWQYKPQDAANKDTVASLIVNSSQFKTSWDTRDQIDSSVQALTSKFAGYNEQKNFDRTISDPTVLTRSILYTKNPKLKDRPSNYFYILDESYPLSVQRTIDENGKTDWDKWYQQTLSQTSGDFNTAYENIVKTAQQYNQTDPNTVEQNYGYLWTTQNPLHYFYFTVKESMNEDYTLNDLYNALQGDFVLNKNTGDEDLRKSDLMYIAIYENDSTGKLEADTGLQIYGEASGQNVTQLQSQNEYVYQAQRDVLDLNHLFTNTIPYLYEMTLATGGTENKDGGFFSSDDTIGSEYQVYEGNLKQWLFRSNWAIKIVENDVYNKKQTIRDSNGNKYTVTSTWDPKAYPSERPMVFSRAQQILQGLDDKDLQQFELKCVQLNEKVCLEWTKLINYLNLENMQTEVMYREMAIIALLEFNKTFQPQTFSGSNFILYPNTLDIRYISFDSIMRMLMLNVSKDTQYIYNDTMQNIIKDTDVFTAIILLLAATICSGIVPFLRDILMALIFYLGVLAMFRQLFMQAKTKIHIQTGLVLCNLMLAVMTTAYYWVFQAMMGITTYDAVLDLGSAQIQTGTPLWCFLFVLMASMVYLAALIKTAIFVWRNKNDMGFEFFAEMTQTVAQSVNTFTETVGSKFSEFFGDQSSQTGYKSKAAQRAKDLQGSGDGAKQKSNDTQDVQNVKITDDNQIRQTSSYDSDDTKEYDQTNYQTGDSDNENKDFSDSKSIDDEIEKGKEA